MTCDATVDVVVGRGSNWALTRVAPLDVPTVAGVTVLMAAVVLIATLGPALRASRTSPVEPLRAE